MASQMANSLSVRKSFIVKKHAISKAWMYAPMTKRAALLVTTEEDIQLKRK